MIITSLIENTRLEGRDDLAIEHGLSLHIRHNGHGILFDTGISGNFVGNAEKLGVSIPDVTCAVISHHHYDHGGGLKAFTEANGRADIWLKRCETRKLRFKSMMVVKKDIGLNWRLLDRYPERLSFLDDTAEILPDVFLTGVTVKKHPLPSGNRYLYKMSEEGLVPDDFTHELIMVIREPDGLVIFSGCSHNGILNMIDTVLEKFPETPVKGILGGFHLIDSPILGNMAGTREEIGFLGERLLAYAPDMVYTGHCTGRKAYGILKDVMGDTLDMFSTGKTMTL